MVDELLAVGVTVVEDVTLAVAVLLLVGLAVGLLLGVLVDVPLLVTVLEAVGVCDPDKVAPQHPSNELCWNGPLGIYGPSGRTVGHVHMASPTNMVHRA